MESKGNAALLKTTRVTEWNVHYGGYFAVSFGGFILLGCLIAYLLSIARGNIDAVLPLISDAAGSPPQNGLFGTLICLGGMCGVVFMIQRYMIVLEKNCDKSSVVIAVNKISLFFGIVAMLGITLITGYPVNFHRNRDIWLTDVGLPHMIGGAILFSFGLVYMALQTILTLFLKSKNETSLSVRILLVFICSAAFVYHMITVPEHFSGVSHMYYVNRSTEGELNYTGILPYPPTMGIDLKVPIDTGGTYVNAAISQWVFVIFFCCFFFTFYKEAQEYSLLIVIETHCKDETEGTEEAKSDALKIQGDQGISKPAPELRKVLRCDSTCQTMTDDLEIAKKKIIECAELTKKAPHAAKKGPPKSEKSDVPNGKEKALKDVDVKVKQPCNGNTVESETAIKASVMSNTETCPDSNVCNQSKTEAEDVGKEEERQAIERIDAVVKNAEDAVTHGVQSNQDDSPSDKKSEDVVPSTCPLSVQ